MACVSICLIKAGTLKVCIMNIESKSDINFHCVGFRRNGNCFFSFLKFNFNLLHRI